MADNLPDVIENQLLDALFGNASFSVTGDIKLALMTTNGNDASAGTEVTGGSYARQTVVFDTAAAGATDNTTAISFTGMPAVTVVGIEIYDSAGSPKRLMYGPLTTPRTVTAGDTVQFAIGAIDVTLS
jgi:flagellar basal body rod protein FlgC